MARGLLRGSALGSAPLVIGLGERHWTTSLAVVALEVRDGSFFLGDTVALVIAGDDG